MAARTRNGQGAFTPVLTKLSGHTSVRSLGKYAGVSDKGLSKSQADPCPAGSSRAASVMPESAKSEFRKSGTRSRSLNENSSFVTSFWMPKKTWNVPG